MESMESHEAGFPPFPHSLEIPSGLPHSHGLDGWIYVLSYPLNSNHRHRKWLVTDVSGPQRNACPGTLITRSRFSRNTAHLPDFSESLIRWERKDHRRRVYATTCSRSCTCRPGLSA